MRVVLDTNVAIAAVAARGLCEAVLELCLERHCIILCEGILSEIEGKLRKLKVPSTAIAEYLHVLRHNALIFEPEKVETDACRDSDDLKILGLVMPGNAEVIVTGDNDLLSLKEYKKAKIMNPRSFWELNKQE